VTICELFVKPAVYDLTIACVPARRRQAALCRNASHALFILDRGEANKEHPDTIARLNMKKSLVLPAFIFSLLAGHSAVAGNVTLENVDIYILPEGLAFRKPISEEDLIKYSCGYRSNDKLVVKDAEGLLQKHELREKVGDVAPLYYFMRIRVSDGKNTKDMIFGEQRDGVVVARMSRGSRDNRKVEYGRTLEQDVRKFIGEKHLSLFQNPGNQSNC
jgi:hypothetical protein